MENVLLGRTPKGKGVRGGGGGRTPDFKLRQMGTRGVHLRGFTALADQVCPVQAKIFLVCWSSLSSTREYFPNWPKSSPYPYLTRQATWRVSMPVYLKFSLGTEHIFLVYGESLWGYL